MSYRKLSLSLGAVLACFGVMAASAQQLNSEQIQQIETMTSVVCTTVKEQKGSASRDQLQADVSAKIGGVFGKILPVEGAAGGSMSKENFEGLSRDATAAALEGDRSCRERVFNTMFDGFKVHGSPAPTPAATSPAAPTPAPAATSPAAPTPAPAATASTPPTTAPAATASTTPAPAATASTAPTPAPAATALPVTTSTDCAVNNPSGNPMNVRETPNGAKKDIISNRAHVRPLRYASAADGKSWAYVSDATGREIGWVFYPYLACNGPGPR